MNSELFSQLKTRLKEHGAECRIISVSHLPELESEYHSSLTNVHIDRQFADRSIQHYIDFSVSGKYPAIRSIIVIASPSPEVEVRFNDKGKIHLLKIPPHYSDRLKVNRNIREITSRIFDGNGYRTYPVVLPKKLLAARSGLARYGRNNITYIPGMGSYHRLTVFGSDFECDQDSWYDVQMLERCNKCEACQKNCPTGAIGTDHFLIKAERCLTYFNEHPDPFPAWIDPGSHNSIIGCMRCQNICPENIEYRSARVSAESFSETETSFILKGIPYEELPEKLKLKLGNLSLQHYYKLLSRNITLLFEKNKTIEN